MITAAHLPGREPLLTRRGWAAWFACLALLCALAPLLNLWVGVGSVFHLSDFGVALVGKIMCYALCALAMDLIWGYTGILSLGHGLFFALGGYAMGMYLMRQIGLDGNYKSALPDFMVFLDWKSLPWHWLLSDSLVATLILVPLVPALVALVFGFFAFRSRIKGVWFRSRSRPPTTDSANLVQNRPDLLATHSAKARSEKAISKTLLTLKMLGPTHTSLGRSSLFNLG